MLRLSTSSICPFCEVSALYKSFYPSWRTSTRSMATMQKRQPSRMVLSEKVAQGPPRAQSEGRTTRRSRNSPWGAMNRTTVPREVELAQKKKMTAADHKRQARAFLKARTSGGKAEKTREPMKALKMQRRLANVSYEKRGRIKQELAERDSFDEFDLLPSIKGSISSQALGGLEDVSPTPIQRLAVPAILGTQDLSKRKKTRTIQEIQAKMEPILLAAETGSGKTLAYLLPVIDAIKRAEEADKQEQAIEDARKAEEASRRPAWSASYELETPDIAHTTSGRPRAIVLLPTAELVAQVGTLVKSLSHTIKFRSAAISASVSPTVIRNRLFSPAGIDIVISTPHLLQSITESDPNLLSRVTHLIIDEADSLLDRSFSPITSAIIDRATPSLHQLILCSATIPRSLDSYLNKRYPNVRRLVTPNLHAIPRRVQLSVVDIDKVPYQGNRDLACAQTIWDIGKETAEEGPENSKKIVVFVNEREKTAELTAYLRSKGIDATALSRDSDERKMSEVLAAFVGSPSLPRNTAKTGPSPPQSSAGQDTLVYVPPSASDPGTLSRPTQVLSNTKVLVMTDLGSRGIDTLQVRHVVLYDVPHTSIDFIHRLGRVGRMGRRGRGVVLVGKNDRKDVVREVREGMFKGQALI